MDLTPYHAKYYAYELTKRCSSDSIEKLAGALLDRLTHHVHILEMNGESFRLATSKKAQRHGHPINANAKLPTQGDANTKI